MSAIKRSWYLHCTIMAAACEAKAHADELQAFGILTEPVPIGDWQRRLESCQRGALEWRLTARKYRDIIANDPPEPLPPEVARLLGEERSGGIGTTVDCACGARVPFHDCDAIEPSEYDRAHAVNGG